MTNSNHSEQSYLYDSLKEDDSLNTIQNYIKKITFLRGFINQTPTEKLLLLTEEIGELAKAIRKDYSQMTIDLQKLHNYKNIENEIADVFIVLLSLCNELNINCYKVLLEKESENIHRLWK